jgi:hypothetical protein
MPHVLLRCRAVAVIMGRQKATIEAVKMAARRHRQTSSRRHTGDGEERTLRRPGKILTSS